MGKEVAEQLRVQKFKWTRRQTFTNYQDASTLKTSLLEEGFEHVKIKRCGEGGTQFKVVVGSLVKTNKKDNNKKHNQKENTNAN